MKELLEKFDISEEFATAEEAATAIRVKVAEILKHDPDFIEPIKTEATKKVQEQVIVAEKKAKKAFKAIAGVDLSNSEIEAMSLDDLYKTGIDKLKSATGSDAAKLQEEIIQLANALQAEKESKESEISRILTDFKTKEVTAKANTSILTKLADIELVVDKETAFDFLTTKLSKEGINFHLNDDGSLSIRKGEYDLLKADRSGKADIDYLINTYLQPFIKRSNGSGQGGTGQTKIVNGKPATNPLAWKGVSDEEYEKLNPAYRKSLEAQKTPLKSV